MTALVEVVVIKGSADADTEALMAHSPTHLPTGYRVTEQPRVGHGYDSPPGGI